MTFKIRAICALALLSILLAACGPAATPAPTLIPFPTLTPTPQASPTPQATATPTEAPTATLEPTPAYPPAGLGPTGFAADVNPLTGLVPADPTLLNRRPVIIKVQNLPREDRPQFGVSKADIVYEYYTEFGSTRFAAIYYGQDAEQVAPIRSGRYFDANLIRGYKAIFIFGSADQRVYQKFANSEFSTRLVLEGPATKSNGVLSRYDPEGKNFLMVNTSRLTDYLSLVKVDNSRQNLDGMFFKLEAPAGGTAASQLYVHFSSAIYNRWDYDTASGKYLRSSETQNYTDASSESYKQLTDRVTGEPISADNVVIIMVLHEDQEPNPEVEMPDMKLLGEGTAYIARDGQLYPVKWQRKTDSDVLTLVNADGSNFAFKPGQTWFEVLDLNSTMKNENGVVRFNFIRSW